MNQLRLSPSKLNEFNACPRCFYDAYTLGIKKPRGIFPSLPGGLDRALKTHFDRYRGSIPPEIKDRIEGFLVKDQTLINKWRNWRSGLTYRDDKNDIVLIGALDDCVVYYDAPKDYEYYIPLDYKSKGSEPKDSGVQYYQTQLDCYNLMLHSEGYRTRGIGYLVYFYPRNAVECIPLEPGGISTTIPNVIFFKFGISVFKIECSVDRAKELIIKAAECLRSEDRPEPAMTCEHCAHIAQHLEHFVNYVRKEEEK